jgi:hypothetical protein
MFNMQASLQVKPRGNTYQRINERRRGWVITINGTAKGKADGGETQDQWWGEALDRESTTHNCSMLFLTASRFGGLKSGYQFTRSTHKILTGIRGLSVPKCQEKENISQN